MRFVQLGDLAKLREAEISTRKAIHINLNFADAYSNLGNNLNNLDELEEEEEDKPIFPYSNT